MPYIAPADLAQRLLSLDKLYEDKTNKNLKPEEQPYAFMTYLGSKDITTRKTQIEFIQKMTKALLKLYPYDDKKVPLGKQDYKNKFIVNRCLIVLYASVQWQINKTYFVRSGSNSDLYDLISNECLCLSGTNEIDDRLLEDCYFTMKTIIYDGKAHIEKSTNEQIRQLNEKRGVFNEKNKTVDEVISEDNWLSFAKHVSKRCKELNVKRDNLPITHFVVPRVEQAFTWTGYSLGWAIGERLGDTTTVMNTKTVVTGGVTSLACMVLGGSGSMGAMLFAFPFAADFVKNTAIVFTAGVMGEIVKLLGTATGYGIGLTLDYACKAIYALYKQLQWWMTDKTFDSRLANGMNMTTGEIWRNPSQFVKLSQEQLEQLQAHTITFMIEDSFLIISLGKKQERINFTDTPEGELQIKVKEAVENLSGLPLAERLHDVTDLSDSIINNYNGTTTDEETTPLLTRSKSVPNLLLFPATDTGDNSTKTTLTKSQDSEIGATL